MYQPKIERLIGHHRHEIIKLLHRTNCYGVELGIAEGELAKILAPSGKFMSYIGIDRYADRGHDTEQYKRALKNIGLGGIFKLLRMSFDDALDLFDDESLDFIYIDGYAHEATSYTLEKWYPKVKPLGLFSGDDYAFNTWPKVWYAVNDFCYKYSYKKLYITDIPGDTPFSKSPTWGLIKK
jgi:hypothetical protein